MATETLAWSSQTVGSDQQLAVLDLGSVYTSSAIGLGGSVDVTAILLPGEEIQSSLDYNFSGPGFDHDTYYVNAGEFYNAPVFTGIVGGVPTSENSSFLLVNNGRTYHSPAGLSHTVTARFDFSTNDTLTYAEGVENLNFWLGGISGGSAIDVLEIIAFAPDGTTQIPASQIQFLSAGTNVTTGISGGAATLTAGAAAAGLNSESGAVNVVINVPVGRIEIAYFNGGTTAQAVSISDFTFDSTPLSPTCFAKGTRIKTTRGEVAVETLTTEDYVVTAGRGPMQVRWVGHRKFAAKGVLAPIFISEGALGNQRALLVSPAHRMLISGFPVAVLFDEDEVLVPAEALLDSDKIYRKFGGEVEYYHILLDSHEVIFAEGAPCESLFLGANGSELSAFAQTALTEVRAIFPELSMPVARPVLGLAEATLLTSFAAL